MMLCTGRAWGSRSNRVRHAALSVRPSGEALPVVDGFDGRIRRQRSTTPQKRVCCILQVQQQSCRRLTAGSSQHVSHVLPPGGTSKAGDGESPRPVLEFPDSRGGPAGRGGSGELREFRGPGPLGIRMHKKEVGMKKKGKRNRVLCTLSGTRALLGSAGRWARTSIEGPSRLFMAFLRLMRSSRGAWRDRPRIKFLSADCAPRPTTLVWRELACQVAGPLAGVAQPAGRSQSPSPRHLVAHGCFMLRVRIRASSKSIRVWWISGVWGGTSLDSVAA